MQHKEGLFMDFSIDANLENVPLEFFISYAIFLPFYFGGWL